MTAWMLFAPLLSVFLVAQSGFGQAVHEHAQSEANARGQVHFPISCKGEVRSDFSRAVARLHSFGYQNARRDFLAIVDQDPECGMAWWGVAMTYFHQHWDQPRPAELSAGRRAAEKATAKGARTKREQAYIGAISAFYRGADTFDHITRALAYKSAMQRLADEFPDDHEASIFYALALLATRQPDDASYTSQKKAGEILNRLLPEHPEHPGIVHYIIHAFDYPELAELALPAARIYAKLAPDSPHALHMPSHIFTRLGLWEESIASNLAVARLARKQMTRTSPGAVAFEHLHANDYLIYAYLQLGQDEKALEIVQEMASVRRMDDPNFAAAYALVSVPARYAVERRDWQVASVLQLPEAELQWENYPYARGNAYYANALGAARRGDAEQAGKALSELTQLQSALAADPPRGPYDWAGRIEAMRLAAAGWLAYVEGRKEESVSSLQKAAELEERVGKHAVSPGPILPAREQLGDLLLELGHPEEALAAYETSLADSPKRLNGLAGAAHAARLSGKGAQAKQYYGELHSLCRPPGCRRATAQPLPF